MALRGDVLEIGGGSGVMADGAARAFPAARITVTDIDDAMVSMSAGRLGPHNNLRVQRADVTALPFRERSFDFVTSWLMLHHVIDWTTALSEVSRVLRPSGAFVGYDLTDTAIARATHRLDGSHHRIIAPGELTRGLSDAGLVGVTVNLSMRGHVMRFRASRHDPVNSSAT